MIWYFKKALLLLVPVILLIVVMVVFRVLPGSDFAMAQLVGLLRGGEKLPTVTIEHGQTVYCRMQACDFRFPLPSGSHVKSIEQVNGGFDTIRGVIYVTNASGGPVDLRAYAELLRTRNFSIQPGFTSEVENAVGLAPARINHPYGYSIPWDAGSADGGCVAVDLVSNCTKIGFSFFGDF